MDETTVSRLFDTNQQWGGCMHWDDKRSQCRPLSLTRTHTHSLSRSFSMFPNLLEFGEHQLIKLEKTEGWYRSLAKITDWLHIWMSASLIYIIRCDINNIFLIFNFYTNELLLKKGMKIFVIFFKFKIIIIKYWKIEPESAQTGIV